MVEDGDAWVFLDPPRPWAGPGAPPDCPDATAASESSNLSSWVETGESLPSGATPEASPSRWEGDGSSRTTSSLEDTTLWEGVCVCVCVCVCGGGGGGGGRSEHNSSMSSAVIWRVRVPIVRTRIAPDVDLWPPGSPHARSSGRCATSGSET